MAHGCDSKTVASTESGFEAGGREHPAEVHTIVASPAQLLIVEPTVLPLSIRRFYEIRVKFIHAFTPVSLGGEGGGSNEVHHR